MKRVNGILAIILLMIVGCGGSKQSDDFITVDVTKSYPKKELILQDFMDVEYIPLETRNDFLCQGIVMAIGKDVILVKNQINDGDIFVFDRDGKGLRKFNRKGRGPEEYSNIQWITLDEDNDEIFVIDAGRTIVYDLYGKYKRSFQSKDGYSYRHMYNFDKKNLICNNSTFDLPIEIDNELAPFVIISKEDGIIKKYIQIPYEQRKSTMMIQLNSGAILNSANMGAKNIKPEEISSMSIFSYFPVIPYDDSWIIAGPSFDTIFRFLPDYGMKPFMVRTPSIQSMNTEVFLFPTIHTERYYFMESRPMSTAPRLHLMYDRHEKIIYECTVFNDDFSTKSIVNMFNATINTEIAFQQKLEADDLFDAYKEGKLKGKLKEIAAGLKEEDNPVIMLVKHKK